MAVVMNLPFRVYASTYSEFESLVGVDKSVPCHIALAFARDRDSRGNPTAGEFHPYFNTTDITPDDILKFKQTKKHAKFFLSIGGRSEKYPFNLPTGEWVPRAVDSLKEIIRSYHFDGIDVYYQQIDRSLDPNKFVEAWQETIKKLQDDIPSLEVSLTVPPPLDDLYYWPLYLACADGIDYVIYQTHSISSLVPSVKQLVEKFKALRYTRGKLFAGHSILKADWQTVPLPVFLEAIPALMSEVLISGLSQWAAIGGGDPVNCDGN